jgi:hypothetical protein
MAIAIVAGDAMAEPEDDVRLSPEQRAALAPHYDASALEQLLARVPAEIRPRLLAAALVPSSPLSPSSLGAALPFDLHGGPNGPRVYLPTQLEDFHFSDPAMQSLLERVWQPRRGRRS